MFLNIFKNLIDKNKWLLFVLLSSFILSLVYSFYFQIRPQVDARAYDIIAQNIVNGFGYRENLNLDIDYDRAIDRVGPLYEYFLALIYKIFGHNYSIVWVIQAILHSISAYIIYLICLLVFNEQENRKKIGILAAGIFGFYPDLIEISAMLMTETLYLFFTCLIVYLFILYIQNNRLGTFLLLSFISGLAVLTRPPLLLFLLIFFFYLYKNGEWRKIIMSATILILVFLPWTISNYKKYEKIIPFGTAGALNFWIGNHIGASGEQEPSLEIVNFINTNTPIDTQNESLKQFKYFVLNHPLEFTKLTILRINKYFSVLRPMGFWFYNSGWGQALFVISSFIYSLVLFIIGFKGFLKAYKLNSEYKNYLILFTIVTPLILFITVVETRYRFQIYPLLAIFSAYYISLINLNNKKAWFKNLLIPSLVILMNGLIDGLINFNIFKDKIINYLG